MKHKKKILLYIHQCILKGGVEKVFYNLINNLPPEEYDITILSVMGYLKDDFEANLFPPEVKRSCMMWDEFSGTSILKRLRQKIHNRIFPLWCKVRLLFKKYDIAIAAQEGAYAEFVINHVKAKKKLLWIHNDIEKCHWTLSHFGTIEAERRCYDKFDKVVCVSRSVADSMNTMFGKMNNLTVCYNPVDTHEIDRKLKSKLPDRPSENPWFVCVGRLCHQKGYDRLIRVCNRLNKEGYHYAITILGDGEDREMLEQMLAHNAIDNIHLLGNVENPFVFMKQADWLLLPSRHEGFGMVLHEAVYCGTPVIATDVCGVSELLGDSEYGIVIENSEEAIYEGLKKVLDNPRLHIQYKEAVKRRLDFIDLNTRIKDIKALLDN